MSFQDKNTHSSRGSSLKINRFVSDEEFKANYNPNILQKQSTLVLKTSFHLINYILMGMCQTFKNMQYLERQSGWEDEIQDHLKDKKNQTTIHKIDVKIFME